MTKASMKQNDRMRAIVVGARRRRQGIGEFVARFLIEEGVDLCAVVGSQVATARLARDELFADGDAQCRAYSNLDEALSRESPDLVCVCSPYGLHHRQLETVAKHDCNCLCEKPLWWEDHDERVAETARLVDLFVERGRLVRLLTQWPCTLPDFHRLHPGLKGLPLQTFQMHLGPISRGPEMIVDAAPHPLSMIQELVGCGIISAPTAEYLDADRRDLCVYFDYLHANGGIETRFRFTTTERAPRPASYSINGAGVTRSLELPQYDIFFSAENRKIRIEDPLRSLVRDFLEEVASGALVRRQELIESVGALEILYSAAQQAV